jgi:hypothetical protein
MEEGSQMSCKQSKVRRARVGGVVAVVAAAALLAGCGGPKPPSYPETFAGADTYSRTYPATPAAVCEAARRSLLSQGYTIGKAQTDSVDGQKSFEGEDQQNLQISFHVVCAPDSGNPGHGTVFVNAVQDRYVIKKTSNSAGVGLSVLGSVSLPVGSSDDSLAKVGSETISTPSFYDGFFGLLVRFLPEAAADTSKPAAPAAQPATAPTTAPATAPATAPTTAPATAPATAPSTPGGAPPQPDHIAPSK